MRTVKIYSRYIAAGVVDTSVRSKVALHSKNVKGVLECLSERLA